ncbi:hypothetical protein CCH79_00013474 [Gambusia affinis]|uniref:small monomeric GTPase n=1 Tax=Gambusia affinis TaxID=33528 RepID=A0A315WR07_GAMAF|nr:hypothetical protein CCH79_00013474 [Gambusia affinis]
MRPTKEAGVTVSGSYERHQPLLRFTAAGTHGAPCRRWTTALCRGKQEDVTRWKPARSPIGTGTATEEENIRKRQKQQQVSRLRDKEIIYPLVQLLVLVLVSSELPSGLLVSNPLHPHIAAAMMSKSALLKVILLGDGGVGKSSLMNRYVTNKFDSHLFHTIGVEFLNRELEVDGRRVTLQIWDTAGQERFRSLRTPFYRGSDCCLLTFSLDDGQSFQNLSNWKKEFAFYADVKDPDSFPFVVLGNKLDVPERQVSGDEARRWCRENGGHPYFETSAKDATNVASAFEEAVRRILASEDRDDHLIQTDTVNLVPERRNRWVEFTQDKISNQELCVERLCWLRARGHHSRATFTSRRPKSTGREEEEEEEALRKPRYRT